MRLLLCEDEVDISDTLVEILKLNKYSVDAVYDGEEALDYLEFGNYDCVILDIMMPKKYGLEVLQIIRKMGNNIPVIMLTAKSELDDRVLGLDSGADDYLAKPFEIKELLARIRSITRRQSEFVDNVLEFSDLKLNRATYELICDEKTTKLPPKEFQMLEMLMKNPKQYISTDHFMEKIWGYDSDAEINVVWVCISSVRKRINEVCNNVSLVTSRKMGYRLEAQDAKKT
ncbi:MAG: response regulator transcription factor [Bacilli bacterium]